MNQPLHNNAIPAHPVVAAQQKAAIAAESEAAPTPTTVSTPEGLWDAFEESPEPASSPAPVASPPPAVEVQPPAAPTPVEAMPPTVEELLGGAAAPVVQAPEVSAPQQPSEPQQPAAQPVGQQPVDMAALQKQAIDYLMANEYRLSEQDRASLISAPDEVLPQMAARMHVGIATQLAQQVAKAIPAMIQQQLDSHMRAQRAELEFFGRYPKLNRPEYKPIIAESLQMVKSMNPQASREEVIAKGAALAAFQIQSRFGGRQQPQAPQPPARASAPPYAPVAPGGGGALPPTNPEQANPFWQLAQDPDWNPW